MSESTLPRRSPAPPPLPPNVPPARTPPRRTGNEDESARESLNLREVFSVLRRNAWLVLAVAASTAAIAAVAAYRIPAAFRARAVIQLADARAAVAGKLTDDRQGGVGLYADPLHSQIQVLSSRAIAGEVIDRTPVPLRARPHGLPAAVLTDLQIARNARPDSIEIRLDGARVTLRARGREATAPYGSPVDLAGVRLVVAPGAVPAIGSIEIVSRERAIDAIVGGLRVAPRAESDVINVDFTASDPDVAAGVVNTLVDVFQTASVRSAKEESRRRRLFVEDQLRRNDSLLADAQETLAEFRSREQTFGARETFAVQQRDATTSDAQRQELSAEREVYAGLLADLNADRAPARANALLRTLAAVPAGMSNPVIGQLYAQLIQYAQTRDSLTTGPWAHAATHPDVQRLDTLIAATQGRVEGFVRNQVAALEVRIRALGAARERAEASMQRLPAVEAEDLRLSNEVGSIRGLGNQLREEQQKARIAEAVEVGQVEILDLASAGMPVGGGPMPKVLIGLLVGVVLGCGGAFLREHLDTTIVRRDDVQRLLHVPALGVIPQRKRTIRRWLPFAKGVEQSPLHAVLVGSAETEAYATLRTNLLYARTAGSARTVVVTSAAPGDGKTTVSANLARAIALQGGRVLHVDCDLRRSRAHSLFGVPQSPGLTDVLLGRVVAGEAIRRVQAGESIIHVLPAGSAPPNPAELLGSPAAQQLLEELANEFDFVLFDSPPILAVADPAILAARADVVMLIVRAGTTERDAARFALEQLAAAGARVVGAVLNDPDGRVPQYEGYHYYGDYYVKHA